jgi:hypothetical protein
VTISLVVFALTPPWIAVIALGVFLVGLWAVLFLLLAMGRLHLDLGWGRSLHALGPIEVRIAAQRDLVFELISAPYLGGAPGDSGVHVLAAGGDLVVAAHDTNVHFYTARTVETVRFEPPKRVDFKLLTGPVPHAVEYFALEETGEGTELRYGGEVGIDFFFLGRLAGRYWVRGQWERAVREHLEEIKERAEELAARGVQPRSARSVARSRDES